MVSIGFIGLGLMGQPMAANLVKAGLRVTGFDLVAENLKSAADKGVVATASAEEAARAADVIVTMLPAGKDTLAVWGGPLMQAAKSGTLLIDSSTIDVASARTAHGMAAKAGMLSLDAPVSGGVGGAEAGTLTFMCGGTTAAFEKAKPVLEAMGKRIVHCGRRVRARLQRSATT